MRTKLTIALGLVACFAAGVFTSRTYFERSVNSGLTDALAAAKDSMQSLASSNESDRVRALHATIDTLRMVRELEAKGATDEERRAAYRKELLHRSEDVKDARDPDGRYGNRHSVEMVFLRANELNRELGGASLLDPDKL